MSEELKKITTEAEAGMKKAINYLEIEISKIRAGKASPSILEGVNVDYYGTPTPKLWGEYSFIHASINRRTS